ncbi:Lar family restriction alleviation protein [Pseudomonas aeruginosa]|uniref:Lar family restriction alleviation protein n=1 Tax=Pseudomonas aeruginosa TaxID=287 RepID=UPI000F5362B8|nr:Lar family restriction alleviation protein [Pseudomonas aeruginosa]
MTFKLAECPFCGCTRIGVHFRRISRKEGFQAMCLGCRVGQTRTLYSTFDRAALAWNTRTVSRSADHGIAIPSCAGAEALNDLVPCSGIPKGWGIYAEGDEVFLAKIGDHGGACWTVSFAANSGLDTEKAAALFLASILLAARPIAAEQAAEA